MTFHAKIRRLLKAILVIFALAFYFTYAAWLGWFPAPLIAHVHRSFEAVFSGSRQWYLDIEAEGERIALLASAETLQPGLIALSGVGSDNLNFVRVVDRTGNVVQEWKPDWFALFDSADWAPESRRPNQQPGAPLHGFVITQDGDVVFNLEKLATIRLDACGDSVWKLKNFGHHAMFEDRQGNFWLPSVRTGSKPHPSFRNINAAYQEDVIQKISPEGEILLEKSLFDILSDNDLAALLYMSTNDNAGTSVSGDILHLNDIEIYEGPDTGELVKPGDILVSMRNINSVALLEADSFKVKKLIIGTFLRQHDPDFLGGDRIAVFDNNNLFPGRKDDDAGSRILAIDLVSGDQTVLYEGDADHSFFGNIMGKLQMLANGNLLITASMQARAFEVSPDGKKLWQYQNLVDEGYGGIVTQAEVLPIWMDKAFFDKARKDCAG